MTFKFSLRVRLIVAFLALTCVINSGFAVAIYWVWEDMEELLFHQVIDGEAEGFLKAYELAPEIASLPHQNFQVYISDAQGSGLPTALQQLATGSEIAVQDKTFFLHNKSLGDTDVYFLFDMTTLEERETTLMLALAGGVLVSLYAALWLGSFVANRVIEPVRQLATRVNTLNEDKPGLSFAPEYPHDEVGFLAQAFDQYIQRLQQFLDRERCFTADVSHELRTPAECHLWRRGDSCGTP